jgi:putative NADH-flavin reductase
MNITVIGAAGRLGREVGAEAVRRGHDVTGLARSQPAPAADHLARLVLGDARDPASVEDAVRGADAVICTVPGGTRDDPHRAGDVATTLTAAMSDAGVYRLVVTSAYPIVARRPVVVVMLLLRRIFATAYADTAASDQIVADSGLSWTIVRLNRLTDRAPTGPLHVTTRDLERPAGLGRADVAALLVDGVEAGRHARQAINVGGAT